LRVRERQGAAETTRDEVMIEEPEIAADDYLKRTASRLKAEGVAQVSCAMLQGSPAAEIVEAARNAPHAMIVMATHGRTGVRRWLLGSVTEEVIQRAVAPVLVVRV
jgi:nucleotide-binding universal stress UspA family protein